MSTSIEWTATVHPDGTVTPGETWNPVVGCDRISPGCAHCYAKTLHDRRHAAWSRGKLVHEQYRQPFEVVQLKPDRLEDPLRWKRPRRVFVNSVSDLFHADVPDAFIDRVFAVMALTPQHTYQILTKRAERMRDYVVGLSRSFLRLQMACPVGWSLQWRDPVLADARDIPLVAWPIPNVWLGVSCENQHFADERIPLLLQTPAAIRFISAEPLLGSVDLTPWLTAPGECVYIDGRPTRGLDWVIGGGESGHGARPSCLSWFRNIVHDCADTRTACFMKQLGARPYETTDDGGMDDNWPVGAWVKLKHPKGGDPSEWSEYLRVRQFPESR